MEADPNDEDDDGPVDVRDGPMPARHLKLLRSVILGDWSRDVVLTADGRVLGHGIEPSDIDINTGYTARMFKRGDQVLAWWWGKWWPARVETTAIHANKLRLKWDHWKLATSGNKARCSLPERVYDAFRSGVHAAA